MLADRADALRRDLAAAGAGPRVRVALVCAPRADTIAAALALLATGATVVPLGATLPRDDLRRTVHLTRCRLIVAPSGVERTDCG